MPLREVLASAAGTADVSRGGIGLVVDLAAAREVQRAGKDARWLAAAEVLGHAAVGFRELGTDIGNDLDERQVQAEPRGPPFTQQPFRRRCLEQRPVCAVTLEAAARRRASWSPRP